MTPTPAIATAPLRALRAPAGSVAADTVEGMVFTAVPRDADLTVCRRIRADWSRANPLRPFVRPAEVRYFIATPPAGFSPRQSEPGSARIPEGHGVGQRLLLIDDKRFYRDLALDYFCAQRGYEVTVVATATEGLCVFRQRGPGYFHAIVSDVSMELELAGLYLCWQFSKARYRGNLIVASTGFDNFFAILATRNLLGHSAVRWLVSKRALKLGRPTFWRCRGLW